MKETVQVVPGVKVAQAGTRDGKSWSAGRYGWYTLPWLLAALVLTVLVLIIVYAVYGINTLLQVDALLGNANAVALAASELATTVGDVVSEGKQSAYYTEECLDDPEDKPLCAALGMFDSASQSLANLNDASENFLETSVQLRASVPARPSLPDFAVP